MLIMKQIMLLLQEMLEEFHKTGMLNIAEVKHNQNHLLI